MKYFFFVGIPVLILVVSGCATLGDRLVSENTQTLDTALQEFNKLETKSKKETARYLIWLLKDNIKIIRETSSYHGIPGEAEANEEARAMVSRIINALKKMGALAVDPLIEELKQRTYGVEEIVIEILGEIGEEAIPHLERALNTGSYISRDAAMALGRIGVASIPVLINADSTPGSGNAKDALVSMGAKAVPSLIKILKSENSQKRIWVIGILGDIGPEAKEAVPSLIELLNDPNPIEYQIYETIETLGKIGPSAKKSLPILEKFYKKEDLKKITLETIRKIEPSIAAEKEGKEKQIRQKELAKWKRYADELLVNGKLKLPTTKRLLQMAGYSDQSPVRIFKSALFLENQLGYPKIDSYYFVFTTQSKKPKIKKILVILYNHNENGAANLLAYAPMLLYMKKSSPISTELDEFAHYIPQEFNSSKVQEEYVVYPYNVHYYVFNYGEEYKANEGAFRGNEKYEDICDLILRGKNTSNEKAKFHVGEGGKFYLVDIKSIYP